MASHHTNRPAIAMIELIFSIVVIGITLLSAPLLMQQASNSGYVTMQQEGISEAASRANLIMGYRWDEENTYEGILDTVLQSDTTISDLNESLGADNNGTGRRLGTPKESYRSYIDPANRRYTATAPSDLGKDDGVDDNGDDDIDDFGAAGLILVELSDTDYAETTTVSMATEVAYMDDAPQSGGYNSKTITYNPDFNETLSHTSNIKRIKITLTSSSSIAELNKTIVLNAFSCNIGAAQLEERSF
ncbi:hypothetical protein MNB_SV-6-1904 [hydrothermal vent metagenome]|uniref:Uncharacterized protein n=1 Tax=hydrothermal vent metagenome TaxID=652676 RepID=A0A1W1BP27_9ZZZZ